MTSRRGARAGGPLPPTERDRRIIEAVDRHGPMTRKQLQRLFFRKANGLASAQAACKRLKLLVERGYLTATRLPALVGSGPYVYRLGKAAISLLEEDGVSRRVPRAKIETVAGLLHGLEVVDLYIALREALESRGGEIVAWVGEREAQYRLTWQGRRLLFSPDAYCQWAVRNGEEGAFFLEWDRGSESMTRIAQKMETYEAYYHDPSTRHDHLGDVGLKPQILVVVPDERRELKIGGWLGRQLGRGHLAHLPTVLIAAREPAMRDVLGCVWHNAHTGSRVPLVEEPTESAAQAGDATEGALDAGPEER